MRLSIIAFALVTGSFVGTTAAQTPSYQDGDIVFHESQSEQSKAIKEVTRSRWSHVGLLFQKNGQWHVAEAVEPVHIIPLRQFVARGKNKDFRVYRLPGLTADQKKGLRAQFNTYLGQHYDGYFEWSDDLIYCSELVYKVFMKITGVEIGVVQKFRDLDMTGPYAKELIRRRLAGTGRTLNPDEPIVTPDSQIQDKKLVLIERSERQP